MHRLNQTEMKHIAPLFEGWEETLIWSCLQGHMGSAWADRSEQPHSARIITGDFCFFAGVPHAQLVENIPEDYASQYILMIPQNDSWEQMIEQIHPTARRFMRYAIKKEPHVFDRARLQENVRQLSKEYSLHPIDQKLFYRVKNEDWSKDLCSQFPTYEDYQSKGLGYVILHQGEIVSGASSYTVYNSGIKIEIDTRDDYRRKGLALICASRLILECLDRKLYPSWDAANKASVALAEKLGYHFDQEYVTYAVEVPHK